MIFLFFDGRENWSALDFRCFTSYSKLHLTFLLTKSRHTMKSYLFSKKKMPCKKTIILTMYTEFEKAVFFSKIIRVYSIQPLNVEFSYLQFKTNPNLLNIKYGNLTRKWLFSYLVIILNANRQTNALFLLLPNMYRVRKLNVKQQVTGYGALAVHNFEIIF